MDPTTHSSSSLPTDLREYAIFLQKKESEELEAIPISSSSESESDEEPGPPWSAKDMILDKLNSQTHAHLNALFLTRQIVQPPVDIMMNMSPFSKAKFRHRSDSNDYEHMKISLRKKLPTLLEESKKREKQWTLDDFEKGRLLGRGRFAHVWLAREKSSGLVVVLKAISKAKVQKYRAEKALRTEIEVQSHLDHPSIVRLYTFFHDKTHIYLVLEYALEGDLFNFLKRNSVDIDITGLFVYNIANALKYMHANKILHRDLKPENIFINHLGQIKIADFGWSCHSHKPFQFVIVGTTQYMAPEMLKGRGYASTVDIWSLGILFYEMLTGELPFCGDSYEDITEAILHSDWSIPNEESFPHGAVHLLKRLLTRNPAERITVDEIMTHPWIVECIQRIDAF